MTYKNLWLARNKAAIDKRLQWLKNKPEGSLLFQPSGIHFVTVEKKQSLLRMALIDREGLTSDLVQSQLDLNNPLNLISPYSQAMLLSLVWQNEPERIYLAGFGGGRIPLVLHHYFSEAFIECTDIDPTLIEIATQFFGVQFDERLKLIIQDGREYLARQEQNVRYDIILTDVILGNGYTPYRLATREFYELCQTHLSDNGVVAVDLFQREPFYAHKLKTLQSVFDCIYLCSLDVGNAVVIATNGSPLDKSELIARTQALQDSHQFAFPLLEKALQVKLGDDLADCIPHFDQAQILTDTSPPVGYFDNLPSFNPIFTQGVSDRPCPCGSGKLFPDCHGL
ncbi:MULTISPECIES: fused MFS/spermidine synthase [unclassified Coleofasciculus]|uniref:fused MFS/spermidine synthase n=1 Tax=unclassified Coleofasciculus TaxID=2692782 RepID=UPI00187FA6F7|nr:MULTISPECIES: fused MFS/spermidine synthase [unclassified Coleofasciculus]MBE9126986.1 fused MFS/spermidine synthase [Coleofasciculus sp. LEGE 07081]MBE9150331.1 fused MFS/spermidine synthase [Coleofasciculus sp. LEGE 07092]